MKRCPKMKSKILGFLAVGLLSGPTVANAIPIQWDFSGTLVCNCSANEVVGTIAGGFVYDADTKMFSDVHFTSSDTGITYTELVNPQLLFFLEEGTAPTNILEIPVLVRKLPRRGGEVALPDFEDWSTVAEGLCDTPGPCGGSLPINLWAISRGIGEFVLIGTPLVEVPEPAALALLGFGLLGLGLTRRSL